MRHTNIVVICSIFLFVFSVFPNKTLADTTNFRSADSVTTSGNPSFINLSNCSLTDGNTCDRLIGSSFGNLFFNNFGNYNIPIGSTITNVRIRVTGKSNAGIYVGVSQGTIFSSNCQFPSDLWTMWQLVSSTIKTYLAIAPATLNPWCFTYNNIKNDNLSWRINYSSGVNWSSNIDNFEVAYDYVPPLTPTLTLSPTLTPAPTPTPTPTSTPAPAPFLDLPWDYEGMGKSFEDVAFDPSSWFDHEYPLQNVPCCTNDIIDYTGEQKEEPYKSHSGYDYALKNGVVLNTPVLAAASGLAIFKSWQESGGAGNMIKIDHGNGYQTWYEHLSADGLVVSNSGQKVQVNKGQIIGHVGMTGNTNGPHIHFSVFKDENNNDTFDDDYPYGLVDPLGWEGDSTDPWTLWTSNGRKGAKSYNLFIKRAQPKKATIPVSGGFLSTDKVEVDVPSNASNSLFDLAFKTGPFESSSATLKSVSPSFFLDAFDSLNNPVTQFIKPISITYDYSKVNLFNIAEDSLSLYFFDKEQNVWQVLPSTIDTINKTVHSQTTHFTQFALMGEVKDIQVPITEVIVNGEKVIKDWYNSGVTVELNGVDNEDGLGLQYTLYSFNGNDWYEYHEPLIFEDEGNYEIYYQSFDKADNKEERKSLKFNIDNTFPKIATSLVSNGNLYSAGDWTNNDVVISFSCIDALSGVAFVTSPITLSTEGENQRVDGECMDKAGNISYKTLDGINIDKTPPKINLLATPSTIWPPNGKMVDVYIDGRIEDLSRVVKNFKIEDEYHLIEPKLTDFGIVKLEAARKGNDLDGRIYTIKAETVDQAGNKGYAQTTVVVAHDQGTIK